MLSKVSKDYQSGVGLVRLDLLKEVEELMDGVSVAFQICVRGRK